ncbi:hypothetical protein YC2023_094495 [Brassica napus]
MKDMESKTILIWWHDDEPKKKKPALVKKNVMGTPKIESLWFAQQHGSEREASRHSNKNMLEYWQIDKFWDLVSGCLILCLEMLETSALGLGQDLGLLRVLEGAMTNSTYVSRFSFILIPYRFKVRNRFSAYTTCMVGTEHLSKDNF